MTTEGGEQARVGKISDFHDFQPIALLFVFTWIFC